MQAFIMFLPALIVPGGARHVRMGRVRVHRRAIFQSVHERINLVNLAVDVCQCCSDITKQPVGICRHRVFALQLGNGKQRDGELRANHDQLIVFRALHGFPSHLGVRRQKS